MRGVYQDQMSIDKQQQSMENWKKEIIIDPHLNSLFDTQLTAQELLKSKILPLPHQDIVKVYVKLTSLRHALSKNMQKQIETRHPIVQRSFQEGLRSKIQFEQIDQDSIRDSLKHIQKFNQKYELISDRVTEIRNINKILHFSKALQKFKVNVRLLKSLTKDLDQASSSHLQSELLNSLKISKIIKDISSITIKFDFSGIKSYEQERIFLNSTKGAMFGLVEKELTLALSKLPNVESARRVQIEKDVINKFVILNNLMKLKDFCIPYYKNTLKEMSQLLKKSLVIGLSAEEKDPKAYLQTFEEYFTISLRKRLVENGIIFISFDELLSKSGIKTPFNFHFFDKYWENITGFMKDLIAWSIDSDTKECLKEKSEQNLYKSFEMLETKHTISKYLSSLFWRYPIIYQAMTSISNQLHLYLIKFVEIHHYDFPLLKQRLLKTLIPLAQLYYKNASKFYDRWKEEVHNLSERVEREEKGEDYISVIRKELDKIKSFNQTESQDHNTVKIIDWLLFNVKTKQIYDFHVDTILSIGNLYHNIFENTIRSFDSQKHKEEDLQYFLKKEEDIVSTLKTMIIRKKVSIDKNFESIFKTYDNSEGLISSSSEKMMEVLKKFFKYESLIREGKSRIKK